jgi:opacity protein-like surface antigen
MTLTFRTPVVCAVLAAVPLAPALAADYDPPIFVEEAPEFVPVEIGSGWYLRGDIGYNAGDPVYDISYPGVKHHRFGGGIGFGYHFTDNFRADLTVNYLGGDRFSYDDGTLDVEASYKAWSGLVSGYYDIATIMGVTPYVGAGVGLTYSHSKAAATLTDPAGTLTASFDDSSYDFAYALMAGASYKVSDNLSVDLGYQFLHTPDAKYLDVDRLAIREGTKHHQVKVGLRYDLW